MNEIALEKFLRIDEDHARGMGWVEYAPGYWCQLAVVRHPLRLNGLVALACGTDDEVFSSAQSVVPDYDDIRRYLKWCWICRLDGIEEDDDLGLCDRCKFWMKARAREDEPEVEVPI